jgi:branched-chain amino acid transport system ATP-binding protein
MSEFKSTSITAIPMLELKGVKVSYGGIHAVKGIDLIVRQGELVTLIGANGSGKTTTMKAIAGLLAPAEGSILFQDKPSSGQSHLLLEQGLALVPEGRGVFARTTVLENLQMGAYLRKDEEINHDLEKMFVYFPRLKERSEQLAGTLSGGEQQMVAIARALMSRPQLLLLDEPSMGLSPIMVQTIFGVIKDVARQGMTILLVEQNARLALSVAHRAYVMDSGIITIEGDAKELANDPRIGEAYLGE